MTWCFVRPAPRSSVQVTNSIARTISDDAVLLVASIKGGGVRRDFPLLLDSREGGICNLCYVGFRKVCRVLKPEREKLIEGKFDQLVLDQRSGRTEVYKIGCAANTAKPVLVCVVKP